MELLTSHEESRILDFGRNRSHRDKIREERKELNDKLKEQNSIISTEIRDLESLMQDIQHFLEEDSVLRKEPFDVLQLMENAFPSIQIPDALRMLAAMPEEKEPEVVVERGGVGSD